MPKQTPASDSQQFLCIEVSNSLEVMLSTQELTEIITLDPTKILQIPDMQAAVAGIFNWQGEILWLIDIAYMMGFSPILSLRFYEQQKCRVLKVKYRGDNIGLLVQKTGDLTSIETKKINSLAPQNISVLIKKCTKGNCQNQAGETLMILDIEAIIQNIELRL